MSQVSRYWQWIRVDGAGRRQFEQISAAQTFVQDQFASLIDAQDQVPDAVLQRQLYQQMQTASEQHGHAQVPRLAELCLRCFISSALEQICAELVTHVGPTYDLTQATLLPVLLSQTSITALGSEAEEQEGDALGDRILQTFEPDQGDLDAWVRYQVRHTRQVNAVLQDHGLYLISDWTLLNHTALPHLEQILSQRHHLPRPDIHQATQLLTRYHVICRHEHRCQRQAGTPCESLEPTTAQLSQIAQALLATRPHPQSTPMALAPAQVLTQLRRLAAQLHATEVGSMTHPLREPALSQTVASVPTTAVPLTAAQIHQALQWSQSAICEPRQWYVYRQGLALLGFESWLQARAGDLVLQRDRCTLLQPASAHLLHALCNLQVGPFRLCVLATDLSGTDQVFVPRAAMELSDYLPHFFVLVMVQEDEDRVWVQGVLRCDRLAHNHQTSPLSVQSDWTYALPHQWFDPDPNSLLLWLRHLDPTPLSPLAIAPALDTPPPPSRLELEQLLPHLRACKSNIWQVLSWSQVVAILKDPVLIHWLYQAQRSQSDTSSSASTSQPDTLASAPTGDRVLQGTINTGLWLRQEMDPLAQQLSWVMLPPFTTVLQAAGADVTAMVRDLQHQGIHIPVTAGGAYRDLRLAQGAVTVVYPDVAPPLGDQSQPRMDATLNSGTSTPNHAHSDDPSAGPRCDSAAGDPNPDAGLGVHLSLCQGRGHLGGTVLGHH